jgi:predicted Rossmann fold flavoprotein
MAAIFAAAAARSQVLLLERTKDGGRKILISGGGRCNVLPSTLSPADFVTASSSNTMRKMLLSWPLPEQRWFFEHDLGIPLAVEVASGKLFPATNRARDVRDTLVAYAGRRGAEMSYNADVIGLEPIPGRLWRVILKDAPPIEAAAVVLATGGLSVPATGSDGTGLRIARQLGHTVHDTYPALTSLIAEGTPHSNLAGVSLNVTIRALEAKRRYQVHGGFLFTHRGYSGPAVLNISHVAVRSRLKNQPRPPIMVQWCELDTVQWDDVLRTQGTAQLAPTLRRYIPSRVAEMLMVEAHVTPDRRLSELKREERTRIVHALTRYRLPWMGDDGYKKAEVTGGGVSLGEVDPITLESRLHPGLFLCGEMLDAFGPIGGYNFAWAWATGRAAGLGAARYR